jgi:hypothetical protein
LRRVRLFVAAAFAVTGTACTPDMTEEKARLALERFAAEDFSAGHVCHADGRALLRRAARSYSAAMAAKGEAWPNKARLASQTMPSMGNIESYVVMMMAYGFLAPSDLGGDAQLIVDELDEGPAGGWDFEEAAAISRHPHCRAIYGVMRESWAAVLEVAPIQAQYIRANERQDYERARQLLERRNRIIARVQARQEEVRRQIGER